MKVRMTKAEVSALAKASEICTVLATVLHDEDAQTALVALEKMLAKYPGGVVASNEPEKKPE